MLSTLSKVFEKLLFEQINDHMQNKFSKHFTGFHQTRSTQNSLLAILNKKLKVIVLFMDISLSIVFKTKCVWFLISFTKVKDRVSGWRKIKTGVTRLCFLASSLQYFYQ